MSQPNSFLSDIVQKLSIESKLIQKKDKIGS